MHYLKQWGIGAVSLLLSVSSSVWAFSNVQLVADARSQIGVTRHYDPAYTQLSYPMGDVVRSKGVCTDVVIRALRQQGIDLQKELHEGHAPAFCQLSQKMGLKTAG